jgi:hypothetical protein
MAVAEKGWRQVKILDSKAVWEFGGGDWVTNKDKNLVPRDYNDPNTLWIVAPPRKG